LFPAVAPTRVEEFQESRNATAQYWRIPGGGEIIPLKGVLMMSESYESNKPAKRGRRAFTEEFKRDAVRLVVEENYTFNGAAKAVGVSARSLRDWCKKYAPQPEPCDEKSSLEELRDEIKQLRKQLREAEMEREILKKATAYFAKESR
jgi:transposase